MAKDTMLYKELRSRGVRKKVARKVSNALASRDGASKPKAAREAVTELSAAVSRIEERMALDEDRRDAAKKAAKTRKKKATQRRQGARKLAAGRSRS